ncbi:hypothetical protein IKW72_00990 [bacterium]|nr:hypothetical protein [bacterium]
MKKRIICCLILQFAFAASFLGAADAKQWAKAFQGDSIGAISNDVFTVRFPKTCQIQDKTTLSGPVEQTPELLKLQETYDQQEKAIETLTEELSSDLNYGTDEEQAAASEKIKALEDMKNNTKAELEKLKADLLAQEKAKTKNSKQKGSKPVYQMKEENTEKFYLTSVMNELDETYMTMADLLYSKDEVKELDLHYYIYIVTSPKVFKTLAEKPSLVNPARNVCLDKNNNAALVFASPEIRMVLGKTVAYAGAALMLNDFLRKSSKTKGAELAEAISIGVCSAASGLDFVVDPMKITKVEILKEDKLLLPTDLFQPRQIADPVKCCYFTKQAAAVVKQIMNYNSGAFRVYLTKASGGNSGFRSSFQFLKVAETWGADYDDFCNKLNKRIFFPMTEAAQASPNAMALWRRELQDEDDEYYIRKRASGR